MEYKLSSFQLAELASWISARMNIVLSTSDCKILEKLTTIILNEEQKIKYVDHTIVDNLLDQLLNGHKVEAIRLYRMLTGSSLSQAHEAIEKHGYGKKVDNT